MNTYVDEILTVQVFLFQLHAKKAILLLRLFYYLVNTKNVSLAILEPGRFD